MTVTASTNRVLAPLATPLPYGLLPAAQLADEVDPHWQLGVRYQPDVCDRAAVTTLPCPTIPADKQPTSDGIPTVESRPFTVYSWIDCSPPGFLAEARARTEKALTNGEGRAMEAEFWTGAHGTQPHLASNTQVLASDGAILQRAADVKTSSAVDVVEALGLLEGGLASCYGGVGVIHVPFGALAQLWAFQQIEKDGARLRTRSGTIIAAGSGYPGTSPAGANPAAGDSWFYATGAVKLWRSEISIDAAPGDVVNRAKNDTVMIAERTYVVGWDCCLLAAQVQLGGVAQGAVG